MHLAKWRDPAVGKCMTALVCDPDHAGALVHALVLRVLALREEHCLNAAQADTASACHISIDLSEHEEQIISRGSKALWTLGGVVVAFASEPGSPQALYQRSWLLCEATIPHP